MRVEPQPFSKVVGAGLGHKQGLLKDPGDLLKGPGALLKGPGAL